MLSQFLEKSRGATGREECVSPWQDRFRLTPVLLRTTSEAHLQLDMGIVQDALDNLFGYAAKDAHKYRGVLSDKRDAVREFPLRMDVVPVVSQDLADVLRGLSNPAKLLGDVEVILKAPLFKGSWFKFVLVSSVLQSP